MQTDLNSVISVVAAIDPAVIYNSNSTKTGAIIDTKGYEALEFILQTGVLTDGTWTSKVYGDTASDMSTEVECTGNDLIGSAPSLAITDDSTAKRVGVNIAVVNKRYYRFKATQAGATTGGYIAAVAVLARPRFAPVA